jgi:hypothetical protein
MLIHSRQRIRTIDDAEMSDDNQPRCAAQSFRKFRADGRIEYFATTIEGRNSACSATIEPQESSSRELA